MIPKIIHQIWLGPLEPPIDWIDTWRKAHPDWEHRLWSENDFDCPLKGLRQVLLSPTYGGKVDILSYEVLQRFGGIYLDADSICLRPLDGELLDKDFLIAYENPVARPGLIAHGVMGCSPAHSIIDDLIDSISILSPAQMSGFDYVVTGPELITRVMMKHKSVYVMPSYYFFPYHYTGERCSEAQLAKAYAVQIWGSTDYESDVIQCVRKKYGYNERAYCGDRVVEHMPTVLNAVLRQNKNYDLQSHEEGYFLSGESNFRGYKLNRSATLAWALCDAELTTQEIIDLISSEYPTNTVSVQHDVYDVICEFIKMGFIEVSWTIHIKSTRRSEKNASG